MDPSTARSRLEAERMRLQETHKAAHDLVSNETVLQTVEAQLAEIDAALSRVDAGTYGVCEVCGRPIGDGRLEAMPAARYCLDDQARAEGRGAA